MRGGAPGSLTPETVAESFLEVAVESMANAIRQVSTRQGRDAADFTLFCFGGAAGQHACRVARAAGMRRILVHPLASVLSAFGIGVADRLAVRRASWRRELSAEHLELALSGFARLEAQARGELAAPTPLPCTWRGCSSCAPGTVTCACRCRSAHSRRCTSGSRTNTGAASASPSDRCR